MSADVLKQLLGGSDLQGQELLDRLAWLINQALVHTGGGGLFPQAVTDFFGGSEIIGLAQSDKTRPIMMVPTYTKIADEFVIPQPWLVHSGAAEGVWSHPSGVGAANGAEKMVHGTRIMLEEHQGADISRSDFSNAYNSVNRSAVVQQVHKLDPALADRIIAETTVVHIAAYCGDADGVRLNPVATGTPQGNVASA